MRDLTILWGTAVDKRTGRSDVNVSLHLHALIDTIERDRGGDSADRQVGDGE